LLPNYNINLNYQSVQRLPPPQVH